MRFVVFLDIDGVLNTRTTVKRTPYGYTGIDDARVKVLANAIEKCGGGDIVLSSDWKVLDRNHDDYRYLVYFSGITLNLIRQYVGNDEKKVEYSRRTGFTEG